MEEILANERPDSRKLIPSTKQISAKIEKLFWLLRRKEIPGYGSIPLALGLMGRDGGLSTLCHSCEFACQQMVLKTFPGPGYSRSEDGVV